MGSFRLIVLCAALLIVLSGKEAVADLVVTMSDDYGPEAAFLAALADRREKECIGTESGVDALVEECAASLGVARRDLNNDGLYELFVHIHQPGYCGSAGCSTVVFEQRNGEWVYLVGGSTHGSVDVIRDDESNWPMLVFNRYNLRVWEEIEGGGEYGWYCVSNLCRSEGG